MRETPQGRDDDLAIIGLVKKTYSLKIYSHFDSTTISRRGRQNILTIIIIT